MLLPQDLQCYPIRPRQRSQHYACEISLRSCFIWATKKESANSHISFAHDALMEHRITIHPWTGDDGHLMAGCQDTGRLCTLHHLPALHATVLVAFAAYGFSFAADRASESDACSSISTARAKREIVRLMSARTRVCSEPPGSGIYHLTCRSSSSSGPSHRIRAHLSCDDGSREQEGYGMARRLHLQLRAIEGDRDAGVRVHWKKD